jgi:hypothetical protein
MFSGHWPTSTAAVVVHETPEQALEALNTELRKIGLKGNAEFEDLQEIGMDKPSVSILSDGEY